MKALSLAAAAIFFAAVTSASAAPVNASKSQFAASPALPIIQIQHHPHAAPHRPHAAPHRAQRPKFVPGRRYGSAPHGWHRHGARPGDWQRRGCIMVGPAWFCP